jgi:hypothetical protein
MRYIWILAIVLFCNCTEKKKETEMMPVEADNGIGDGAPSLDSILQKEKSFISEEKSDSITNSHQRDSI